MSSKIDWRRDIGARAQASGVTLSEATIEEMAEHLDEIYLAAVRDGASDAEALTRARAALDESAFDVLRARHAPAVTVASSPFAAAASTQGGQHLNLGGA